MIEDIVTPYVAMSALPLIAVLFGYGFPFQHWDEGPSTWRDVLILVIFLPWWIVFVLVGVLIIFPALALWKWLDKPLRRS